MGILPVVFRRPSRRDAYLPHRQDACAPSRGLSNNRAMAQFPRGQPETGGVVEWLMAPVLKTGRAQALVGSNPTPSANSIFDFRFSNFDSFLESLGDEVCDADTNQGRAHDIRQMMRGDVHPGECDEHWNNEKAEADSPTGKRKRREEGGRRRGVSRGKRVVTRAEPRPVPARFGLDVWPCASGRDLDGPGGNTGQRARD